MKRTPAASALSKTCDSFRISGSNQSLNSLGSHRTSLRDDSASSIGGVLASGLMPVVNTANTADERVKRATKDMTINKLQFQSLGLMGRSEEMAALEACALRVLGPKDTTPAGQSENAQDADNTTGGEGTMARGKEFILVSGASGTGKSALAKTFLTATGCEDNANPNLLESGECLYLSTKFDLMQRNQEPYGGIVGVIRDLCRQLLMLMLKQQDTPKSTNLQARYQAICDYLRKAMGSDDILLLAQMITELAEIFELPPEAQISPATKSHNLKEKMNQMVYALTRFFRALSALFPKLIVLSMDDLQWADFSSLHFLEILLTSEDPETSVQGGLAVIGCYRSEEVYEAHILSQTLRCIRYKTESTNNKALSQLSITEIPIDNLNKSDVEELLMKLLRQTSQRKVQDLARICHEKTLGNAFFLVQLLSHLEKEGLLIFNFGLMTWVWNTEDIEFETGATENVLGLLQNKLNDLPVPQVGILLAVMACVGSKLHETTVATLWLGYCQAESDAQNEEPQPELGDLLKLAVEEGFLLHQSNAKSYKFAHDKLQEVALLHIDKKNPLQPKKLPRMKAVVGHIVLHELNMGTMAGHLLFVAVNLLNGAPPGDSEQERAALAQLNCRAAQKAVESSAFANASEYLEKANQLLPSSTKWTDPDYYSLTLELHSLGAEVEASQGNVESMQAYCDAVLQQTERPLCDHFRVYNVLQDTLMNRNSPKEATQFGFDLLKKLGVTFPKQNSISLPLAIVSRLLKVQWRLKERTTTEVNNLPILADPTALQVSKVLDKTATCCYLCDDPRLPLTVLSNLELALKDGLCEYGPPAYASLALILGGVLGDFQGAMRIADCAEAILARVGASTTLSRTLNILNTMVYPWQQPYQAVTKSLLKGYYAGLSSGDVESAMWCIYNNLCVDLELGKSLPVLVADAKIYLKQMRELKQGLIGTYTNIFLLSTLELAGNPDSVITYLALDPDGYPGELTKVESSALSLQRSRLCAFFGHYTAGAQLSIDRGDEFEKQAIGHMQIMSDTFYRGICLYAQAQTTQKKAKKFGKLARQQHAKIKTWSKKGNPNVAHCKTLLDAEDEVLKGKFDKATKLFQQGIVMAARAGVLQDAALGSERCAMFLLNKQKDKESAAYKLTEAIRYYSDWGAYRKVAMLQQKHATLLNGSVPSGGRGLKSSPF